MFTELDALSAQVKRFPAVLLLAFWERLFQGMADDLNALESSANSPVRGEGASQLRGLHLLLFLKGLHCPL